MSRKDIILLGSTGSVGTQTLEVIRKTKIRKVYALSCHKRIDLLYKQIKEFSPSFAIITDKEAYSLFLDSYKTKTKILYGLEGIEEVIASKDNLVVNALVGVAGFLPTFLAASYKRDIALANKESLVTGGKLIMDLVKEHHLKLLPIDSEHSAIFQCLMGNSNKNIEKLILTASGGPFREYSKEELENISRKEALKHPTYSMGEKITIDSSTLMNKGLEIIEAHYLFSVPMDRIEVLIHPPSIVHSMVQYVDGSILAQLGAPDMHLPIQVALSYPDRIPYKYTNIDFTKTPLEFFKPREIFRTIPLAYKVMELGGIYPTILNGANEASVSLFLDEKISFLEIIDYIEKALTEYKGEKKLEKAEDIIKADLWARDFVYKEYKLNT